MEKISEKIPNYNGNRIITGVLSEGNEINLLFDLPELKEDELKDFSTGFIYKLNSFKTLKNFSENYVYRNTKSHDAREAGKYLQRGQNIRRWIV
ncbi:MAG: hypothetical protein L6Q54_04255 [Leptospiraceae bacterium]|nr:hypothetical protein [Leptospiraceae bacterium]